MYDIEISFKEMNREDIRDVLLLTDTALQIDDTNEQLNEILHLLERMFHVNGNNFYRATGNGHTIENGTHL